MLGRLDLLVLGGAAVLTACAPAKAQTVAAHPAASTTAVELDPIEVAGRPAPEKAIVAGQTTTGTKTKTRVVDTPHTITTVTKEQIERQADFTVSQALRYEPGVVAESRTGDRSDSVFIRGFGGFGGNASYVQFLDNLRLPKGVSYAIPSIDPYLLERIDVLRGPASVLYGQSNPGGLINLVGKRPVDVPFRELMTRVGTYGHIESGFDVGGPVVQGGQFLYRVVGLGRDTGTTVDDTKDQRIFIAPMLTWAPDASTSLAVQGLYQHDPSSFQSNWMPALGTLQANPNGQIPYNFQSANPSYNNFARDQSSFSYQASHRFSDTLELRQNLRYMHLDTDFKGMSVSPGGSAWAAASLCNGRSFLCLGRSTTHYLESLDSLNVDNEAESRFLTGALSHDVLVGLDYQWTGPTATYGIGATTSVNYLAPQYPAVTAPALTTRQAQKNDQIGVYGEDQIQYGNWHAQLGVRHDWASVFARTTTLATGTASAVGTDSSATTWRSGLLYHFDSGIAPFVDYATSFEPQPGTSYGGTGFVPTTGEQYEAGVKYQPPGVDALLTAAVYDLTQYNVLTTDTAHTGTNTTVTGCSSTICQVQTGAVESQGVDVSLKTSPLPGLALIASYGLADAKVIRSTVVTSGIAVEGKHPVGVPDQTAGLWGDYSIQDGVLRGLGFGGGVRYIAASYGDQVNSAALRVPEYVLADAQVHYDFAALQPSLKGLSAAVNVTNLFDKDYVSACASANQCFYGTGRTVLGTVTYRF